MFNGRMMHAWDQTLAIANLWANSPMKNPYRKPTKPGSGESPMRPAELHAMAQALEQRNAARNG